MMYIVSLSSDLPSTHRGCPRGGKGAHTCPRRSKLLAVELGLRGVVSYLILHLVVAIHHESAYFTAGRWGDVAAIGLLGATRMSSGLGRSDEECFVPADPKWLPQCRREW